MYAGARTSGNDEDAAADACELHSEAAAGGGFAYATLAAHKDPFQRRLIEHVAQGWVGRVGKVCHVELSLMDASTSQRLKRCTMAIHCNVECNPIYGWIDVVLKSWQNQLLGNRSGIPTYTVQILYTVIQRSS